MIVSYIGNNSINQLIIIIINIYVNIVIININKLNHMKIIAVNVKWNNKFDKKNNIYKYDDIRLINVIRIWITK